MQREGFAAISAHHVATDQGRKGPHAPTRAASALDLKDMRRACARPHKAMSITMSSTSTHSHAPLTWKQADDFVHVATRDGEFAGFVEFDGTTYIVHDNHGNELGSFASSSDARRALDGPQRRTARSIRQTLRRHLSRVRS
jgi:hypothetical protein